MIKKGVIVLAALVLSLISVQISFATEAGPKPLVVQNRFSANYPNKYWFSVVQVYRDPSGQVKAEWTHIKEKKNATITVQPGVTEILFVGLGVDMIGGSKEGGEAGFGNFGHHCESGRMFLYKWTDMHAIRNADSVEVKQEGTGFKITPHIPQSIR